LVNLPGVTATDSMGYRIEALRVYLENQLGDVLFIAAYKHLNVRLIFDKSFRTFWLMMKAEKMNSKAC